MRERLVMQGERHGIEHVEPELLLPASVLRKVDAQLREAVGDGDRDFRLLRFAVAGDGGTYSLRRVRPERNTEAPREPASVAADAVQFIEPREWMAVRLLDDNRAGAVGREERRDSGLRLLESPLLGDEPQGNDASGDESASRENREAEFFEPWIEGEDGGITLGHGCCV